MKKIEFPKLKETVFFKVLENGLKVYILPKNDFHKTYVTLTTNYGGIDSVLIPEVVSRNNKMPDGIAHFLEHLLFNTQDGDVYHKFSKHGAMANAFTTAKNTTYLFSSAIDIEDNIQILLDFVQTPFFTDDDIKKEISIIEQEIAMYDDNPTWRAYFGTLENLFVNHPVKVNLTGTSSSIKEITKEDLYACHRTFYHPKNLILVIVGPVEPNKIMACITENQSKKTFMEPYQIKYNENSEPKNIRYKSRIINMPVKIPKVYVGYKEINTERKGKELIKYELLLNILLDLMFGPSSETFDLLYKSGYADNSFSYIYISEEGFGFSMIGGDSYYPDICIDIIEKTIKRYKSKPLDDIETTRAIKKRIGVLLRDLNYPGYIANNFARYNFNGVNLFEILDILESCTKKDLEEVLEMHFLEGTNTSLILKE